MKGQLLFFKGELLDLKNYAAKAPQVTMNAMHLLCSSVHAEQVLCFEVLRLYINPPSGKCQKTRSGLVYKDLERCKYSRKL